MIRSKAMTGGRSLALAVLASLAASVAPALLGACTSGTTPNCTDAAEGCDPYEAGPDSGATESGAIESSVPESSPNGG
jgi:hypothetical protein